MWNRNSSLLTRAKSPRNSQLVALVSVTYQDVLRVICSDTSLCFVDLLSPRIGSSVIYASDEFFCSATNLITPTPPIQRPGVFTEQGAWYDGWETRRHNPHDFDYAVFKLGVNAATIKGVEIDTGFFTGNHAPEIEVQGCNRKHGEHFESSPSRGRQSAEAAGAGEASSGACVQTAHDDDAQALEDEKELKLLSGRDFAGWRTILPREVGQCGPGQKQAWLLTDHEDKPEFTHIRLLMFPDGGIARFRLYGNVVPPTLPRRPKNFCGELTDLASVYNGGLAVGASDAYFAPPNNLLLPGRGTDMSDGWETKRSRRPEHKDWVVVELGYGGGLVHSMVVDTAFYRGNFPRWVHLEVRSGPVAPGSYGYEPFGRIEACEPDKEHVVKAWSGVPMFATHVRMYIIPDGGVKRLRVFGVVDKP